MKNKILVIVLVLMVAVVAATGCSAKDPLVGKWEDDREGYCYRFEFTENKAINEVYASGLWFKNIYDYEEVGGVIYLSNGQYFEGGTYIKDLNEKEDPFGYKINGDKLTLFDDMVFTHVKGYSKSYGEQYEK